MPVSQIEQITFKHLWFSGSPPPFFESDPETLLEQPWSFSIELPSSEPQADRVVAEVTAESSPTTDGDITYGGNFKPVLSDITIGGGLTQRQRDVISSALSVTLGDRNEKDLFDISIPPIANVNVQFFSLNVPYEERDIDFPTGEMDIAFLRAYEGGSPPSGERYVQVDSNQNIFRVRGGSEDIVENALKLTNVAGFDRTVTKAFVELVDNATLDFRLDYSEDLSGRTIFQIDYNRPLPLFDGFGPRVFYTVEISSISNDMIVNGIDYFFSNANGTNFNDFVSVRSVAGPTISLNVDEESQIFTWTWEHDPSGSNFTENADAITVIRTEGTLPYNHDITIQIDRESNGQGENRVLVEAFDINNGQTVTLEDTYGINTTVQTLFEDIVIPLIENIPGADRPNFSFDYGPVNIFEIGRAMELITPNTPLFNTTTFPPDSTRTYYYFLEQQESGPLTVSINYNNSSDEDTTLEELFDIHSLFLNENNRRIPLKSFFPAAMQDAWRNSTFARFAIRTELYQTTFSDALNDFLSIDAGNTYRSESQISFEFSDYDIIEELVSDFNSNDSIPDLIASAGLYYGELPISFLRPQSSISQSVADTFVFGGGDGEANTDFNLIRAYNTSNFTISELANQINDDFFLPLSVIEATVLNGNGSFEAETLRSQPATFFDEPEDEVFFEVDGVVPNIEEYNLTSFSNLDNLVSTLNTDWNTEDIFFEVAPAADDRMDAVPTALNDTNGPVDISDSTSSDAIILSGTIDLGNDPPTPPRETVTIDFTINFVDDGDDGDDDDGPNADKGLQVALGGYRINGVDFFNSAPNTFFEPVFNTMFDIDFTTPNADQIYLLVRTREDINGDTYSSTKGDYSAVARFSNNFPNETLGEFKSTEPKYVDPWGEASLNGEMPVAFFVPGNSNIIDVDLADDNILDSLSLTINNLPESLDEFAFLARSRTNDNQSMEEAQIGRVFGLVLDNRGVWDILIGPEAQIQEVVEGEFDYLNRSYDHEPIDADEGYDFEFSNLDSLDTQIQDALSLLPVPGFPEVWVLRIESGVKNRLNQLRSNAGPNSLENCSINIDLRATGRATGVEGVCRITIFHDFRCVFDVGLCDFFWNLTAPPEPQPPQLIENNLSFTYSNLVDCQRLDVEGSMGVNEIGVPVLTTAQNVPTLENGNALLLIKSVYTSEIQGFFWPSQNDFQFIQDGNCEFISDNAQLVQKLNRNALYLPDQDDPITDPSEISNTIDDAESYMLVQPRFQFPVSDTMKDCGPDEVVVIGIGYSFKNWQSGFRDETVLIGLNLVLGGDVFTAPDWTLCYRYYYDQEN